ncbi:MFS transporter [Fibrella sp. WM1]|uniref:MFS transporter n=1 Tax=Fibrella musci TaxID=3242485 RepID=UPI003521D38B
MIADPPVSPTATPTPNKWLVLATLAFGTFMATLDSSIVNIALPTIRRELDAGDSVEWVVLSYLLTTTSTLLIMGKLSDWLGRKNMYVTGFGIFVLGSLLCGLSWNIGSLIGFRVVQGLGAAMIFAIGPAIISDTFQPNERGQALGLMGAIVAAGSSTGPVVGGLLLGKFGWASIFFVNVPIGLIAIWRALVVLPTSVRQPRGAFDLVGAGLFLVGVVTLLVGLDFGPEPDYGWGNPLVMGLLGTGSVLLALFIYWESRTPAPMLQLSLFRVRPYTSAILAALLGFMASGGNLFIIPFFLQQLLGFSPQTAGLVLLAGPLTLSIVAPIGGYLSSRVSTRWLASTGLLLAAAGYFSLSFLQTDWSWHNVVWRTALVSFGFALFQSPNSSSALNAAPLPQRGVASSVIAFMRNMGLVVGIALAAAVWYSTRNVYARMHQADPMSDVAQLTGMRAVYWVLTGLIITAALISFLRGKTLPEPHHAGDVPGEGLATLAGDKS